MGLDIGMFSTKQLFGTINGQLFGNIDKFTTTIVALAGVAFSIFIGQYRPLDLQHGFTDKVFRCNKLKAVFLPGDFLLNNLRNLRVNSCQTVCCHACSPVGK